MGQGRDTFQAEGEEGWREGLFQQLPEQLLWDWEQGGLGGRQVGASLICYPRNGFFYFVFLLFYGCLFFSVNHFP